MRSKPPGENSLQPLDSTTRWRLLATPPLDGATNMALDLGLMRRARMTGETVLRVYSWSAPTLSFGRHQSARDHYDRRLVAERGLDTVRRPTGGRAILHWREATYSVTAPADPGLPLAAAYRAINRILLTALRALGVRATIVAATARERKPDEHPCFASPSAGEIVASFTHEGIPRTRKLVGSAQLREDGALLQHGSILIDDDQQVLVDLARRSPHVDAPATLAELLPRRPAVAELAEALFAAVRAEMDPSATPLPAEQVLPLATPHVERFRDPQWTWRR